MYMSRADAVLGVAENAGLDDLAGLDERFEDFADPFHCTIPFFEDIIFMYSKYFNGSIYLRDSFVSPISTVTFNRTRKARVATFEDVRPESTAITCLACVKVLETPLQKLSPAFAEIQEPRCLVLFVLVVHPFQYRTERVEVGPVVEGSINHKAPRKGRRQLCPRSVDELVRKIACKVPVQFNVNIPHSLLPLLVVTKGFDIPAKIFETPHILALRLFHRGNVFHELVVRVYLLEVFQYHDKVSSAAACTVQRDCPPSPVAKTRCKVVILPPLGVRILGKTNQRQNSIGISLREAKRGKLRDDAGRDARSTRRRTRGRNISRGRFSVVGLLRVRSGHGVAFDEGVSEGRLELDPPVRTETLVSIPDSI
ncbi:hypothetical protein ATCV1_z206L [Acanthocystis turfacea chlorella virus 1]|uniref:Uncharacterized protein z206L n=1 Tax=Chlorovirus heliozoae TaxID=322019 RepID=A7K8G6_9PHYC|nr:hypothetical protein ATCV1_z206L [Acanthocystis turfacea chlorella virus 1]ABT16340.1 hypothetical protein ATCV1_z206L [Acanthocystis turfacea chlorella virus 1]